MRKNKIQKLTAFAYKMMYKKHHLTGVKQNGNHGKVQVNEV